MWSDRFSMLLNKEFETNWDNTKEWIVKSVLICATGLI